MIAAFILGFVVVWFVTGSARGEPQLYTPMPPPWSDEEAARRDEEAARKYQEWSKNRSLTEGGEQAEHGMMKKQTFKRVVASGTSNQLGFFVTLNPDCSSRGDIVVRIVNKPQHGSAEVSAITGYLRAAQHKEHPNCAKNKVKGVALNYKSESKYTGDDALDVLMFYPDGWAWEVHLDLSVR